jgi:hypothetical protein
MGAIGPAHIPLAPGAAMRRNTEIERIGPGGTLVAPGPAGGLTGTRIGTPAVPQAR